MTDNAAGFYQTLVAAFSEANAALVGPTKILESVYYDYKPEVVPDFGQTLNIPLPAAPNGATSDIGTTDFVISTPAATTVPLVFNNHPGSAFLVNDFQQFNTPQDIRRVFLDAYLKDILEYINKDLATLFATANFNVLTNITTSSSSTIMQVDDLSGAIGQLATAKVPVTDFGNLFALTHPNQFFKMCKDTTWSANSQVGYQIAGETRRYGMLAEQFGALVDWDPDMPTASASSPNTTTYTSAVFHRHAVAIAVRPLPIPETPVVMGATLMLKGILPVRVMLGYNQLKGGWLTTIDAGYARGVIRPDHGVIVKTAANF